MLRVLCIHTLEEGGCEGQNMIRIRHLYIVWLKNKCGFLAHMYEPGSEIGFGPWPGSTYSRQAVQTYILQVLRGT